MKILVTLKPAPMVTHGGRGHQRALAFGTGLPLPDGRVLDDLRDFDMVRVLAPLGVPGVSDEKGREENARCYVAHLEGIATRAAEAAVRDWIERHRPKLGREDAA